MFVFTAAIYRLSKRLPYLNKNRTTHMEEYFNWYRVSRDSKFEISRLASSRLRDEIEMRLNFFL